MLERIPSALLHHSVLPLLTVDGLVDLDTAVCRKSSRDELHRCMSGLRVSVALIINNESASDYVYHALRWLNDRGIYLKTYYSEASMDIHKIIRHGLLSCFKKVEDLVVSTKGNSTVCNILVKIIDCNHLRKLVVEGTSEGLTDSFVEEVSRRQPGIQHLHLAWSEMLTDASLHHIANNCSQLQCLRVSCCGGFNFSDSAMRELGERCTYLKRIHLYVSYALGSFDTALIRMSHYFINLEDLKVARSVKLH